MLVLLFIDRVLQMRFVVDVRSELCVGPEGGVIVGEGGRWGLRGGERVGVHVNTAGLLPDQEVHYESEKHESGGQTCNIK